MAIPSSDPWFRAEYVTDELEWFMFALAEAFGVPAGNVGIRGNPATHFRGGHRSRRFCLNSPYSTSRTYTVSRTQGDRTGGDGNEIAAGDLSLPHAKMKVISQRADAAARSGQHEGLTEWFGQTDDDQQVEGYDNIANALATSDSSHLWHIHFTFRRDVLHNREFFERLYAALTGQEIDDMELTDKAPVGDLRQSFINAGSPPLAEDTVGRLLWLGGLRGLEAAKEVRAVGAKVDSLLAAAGAEVQRDAELRVMVAAIQAGDSTAIAEAIVAMAGPDLADRVAAIISRTRLAVEPPGS